MEMDKKRLSEDFVASYRSGTWSMSELCEYYGISRPTGTLNHIEPRRGGGSLELSRKLPTRTETIRPRSNYAR